jgi:hypothetical protein
MTYTTYRELPPLDGLQWVSDTAPPAIGSPIIATINACGPAIVTGYFTLEGYLGLMCDLITPPDWQVKQNANQARKGFGNHAGHVFGPEFKPADTPYDTATPYGRACFARDWLDARMNAASDALKAVPGVGAGAMGLTPDDVKQSTEYRRAKACFDAAFTRMRDFNKGFVKTFKVELAADRAAKRSALTRKRPA